MPILNIIIAESALELIPKDISDRPAIIKDAIRRGKKASEILLDISKHYAAMKTLPNSMKRGRPDITHLTLLNILGSPANKSGWLKIYVHTINNNVININPTIRLPRNYNRFTGLIEQLFKEGMIPPKSNNPLMTLEKLDLKGLIKNIKPSKTIMLTSAGEKTTPKDLISLIIHEKNPTIIIGGFQHGDFSEENQKLADKKYAIYPETLDSWIVTAIIIHQYEATIGLYDNIWG